MSGHRAGDVTLSASQGEESNSPRGLPRLALWVGVVGLVISCVAAYWVWERGERQAQSAVSTRGELLADSIFGGIGSAIDHLIAIGGLYQASEQVTRLEFSRFVANFGTIPGVDAIAHAPVVTQGALDEFVGVMRETIPDYQVFEFDADLNRLPHGDRPVYFPIEWAEPDGVFDGPYGFDMGSVPFLASALQRAGEQGGVIATEFLRLPHADDDDGFVLFWPVDDPESGEVSGYAMALMDLDEFLQGHLPTVMKDTVEWEILDVTDAPAIPADDMAWSAVIDVASRRWLLVVTGGEGLLGSAFTATALVLFAGVAASVLAVYGIHQYRLRAQTREELVRLRDLTRAKDQFLASVSHELRTPLTGVVGFAELLRDSEGLLGDGERSVMVESIAGEAADLAAIIDDLLVAARSELDLLTVTRESVSIRSLVCDVVRAFGPEVCDAVVVAEGPDEEWMVLGDPARIRQVLRNLVSNACRYGGSQIEVRSDLADGLVHLRVADDGEELPLDEWERIFEPYHRVHESQGQPAALGIGLNVSRHLARLMGGDLVYRHEAGWGVFEFTLPAGEPGTAD
ncbi:MAG TPA: CHASE domain-containing protein, partial [Acidimicrobiia bacterium]